MVQRGDFFTTLVWCGVVLKSHHTIGYFNHQHQHLPPRFQQLTSTSWDHSFSKVPFLGPTSEEFQGYYNFT